MTKQTKKQPSRRASKTAVTKKSVVIPAKLEPAKEPQQPPSTAIQLSKATGPAALALRQQYSGEEIALMKQTVAAGTTDVEFSWFLYVAKQRNLNPLTKQIHCVKRKTNVKDEETGQWIKKEVMTIQTGIDGYRLIAARAGVIPAEDPPLWEGEGTTDFRCTIYVKKLGARRMASCCRSLVLHGVCAASQRRQQLGRELDVAEDAALATRKVCRSSRGSARRSGRLRRHLR